MRQLRKVHSYTWQQVLRPQVQVQYYVSVKRITALQPTTEEEDMQNVLILHSNYCKQFWIHPTFSIQFFTCGIF